MNFLFRLYLMGVYGNFVALVLDALGGTWQQAAGAFFTGALMQTFPETRVPWEDLFK